MRIFRTAAPIAPPSGALAIESFEIDEGDCHAARARVAYQSSFVTTDGTLLEWGTGDHDQFGDNGVREYDPVAQTQSYVYPNNNGTEDVTQYDNQPYWYIPNIDGLVCTTRGHYDRASGVWVRSEEPALTPTGRPPVFSQSDVDALIYPDDGVTLSWLTTNNVYNPHQSWSEEHDMGVIIGSSPGEGDGAAAVNRIWFCVPSAGIGSFDQPYYITERTLPATVGGVRPFNSNGRQMCVCAGDYVYWGGGSGASDEAVATFFRTQLSPHKTSTSATLTVERLEDLPAAVVNGLLACDPYNNALAMISSAGVFLYDLLSAEWGADVTPAGLPSVYADAPFSGLLPDWYMGGFVDTSGASTLRKIYFVPGFNFGWGDTTSGSYPSQLFRFRSIKLTRV
jgi:hypothetical protein